MLYLKKQMSTCKKNIIINILMVQKSPYCYRLAFDKLNVTALKTC